MNNHIFELIEVYKKGRWKRGFFRCKKCGISLIKKLKLIPYKEKRTIKKKPYIPWGKNKAPRINPKKKR